VRVAVFIDPLSTLDQSADTTLYLLRGGLRRGHSIGIFYDDDISVEDSVYAFVKAVAADGETIVTTDRSKERLDAYDLVLVRKDPPIDMRFTASLTLLSLAEQSVPMLNVPSSILAYPEKLLPHAFGRYYPPTIVTSDIDEIVRFRAHHREIVLKPLYEYRGSGVYVSGMGDRNFAAVIERMLLRERLPVVAQKYLPEVDAGDRRIMLLGGVPIAAVNRLAGPDDHRCNMYAGGVPSVHSLTESERAICQEVGPWLASRGLHFVGLDIINGSITEINTTAPTGLTAFAELSGEDVSVAFWDYAEEYIRVRRRTE